MFETEQRFRFAIAVLLFQKSSQRKTAMVPDDRARTERNNTTGLLKAPAKIEVIPGLGIFWIEAADALKRPPLKRHVTTWNVFGNRVGQQNVAGTAGRRCDTGLNPMLCGWRDVRAAYSRIAAAQKGCNQVIEPIDIRHAVGIGIGEHFALRRCSAGIAGVAQSMIALMDVAHPRELRR